MKSILEDITSYKEKIYETISCEKEFEAKKAQLSESVILKNPFSPFSEQFLKYCSSFGKDASNMLIQEITQEQTKFLMNILNNPQKV